MNDLKFSKKEKEKVLDYLNTIDLGILRGQPTGMPPGWMPKIGSLDWPTTSYWVSSGFGMREHPVTHKKTFHYGIDIPGPIGTPILAAADGVVMMAQVYGGYGNYIMIVHADGTSTAYGHLSKIDVRVGERVTKGQKIGSMGSTGVSTGSHLHFEVKVNGTAVDPISFYR